MKTSDFIKEIKLKRDVEGLSYEAISLWLAEKKQYVVSATAVRNAYLRDQKKNLAKTK
ncbi:hypothetical protein [Proteus mirabilis]|uniref:hypothetical protein n=1 Tax=Proteus mirabilis TaxID=584 RepID=UPI000D9BF25E|nr:hypothetical protein [Proteus mirabilis]EMA4642792.1 hypothetical protein [Proteus mirabilis]MBG5961670.1 hypothetical protein [Proteus mirabilis]MBL1397235.1 hypothetical protein [Proteus mirabilis]MBQ0656475.1 hypothetical protein [Proteus mirabilis]MDL2104946.1 hypothetical protein [Proteus mirabilis]